MLILAVDDEEDTRKLLRDLLTQSGHRVVTASNAVEAMAHLQMEKFDLILLDVMMPGVDGHQLAQSLVNDWRTFDIPIVIVSCRRDGESKSWAKLNGCFRYLEKPFSPTELLGLVRDVERQRSEEAPPA